jgi:hypothetical protein
MKPYLLYLIILTLLSAYVSGCALRGQRRAMGAL